jgi:hypothetical protein
MCRNTHNVMGSLALPDVLATLEDQTLSALIPP